MTVFVYFHELSNLSNLSNFVYLYMLKFVYSMLIETTDDPYETGCLVESISGLINIIFMN